MVVHPLLSQEFNPLGIAPVPAAGLGDRWVATLAHELRSPLAAVLFALEDLRAVGSLDPSARDAIAAAERSSRQISRLIEDVLDLSRPRSGPVPGCRQTASLPPIIGAAVTAAKPLLLAKGHQLTVLISPSLPAVAAQPSRIEQVVTNLLINAAKFTPPAGRIVLAADATGDDVFLRVSDNGIGIPPELLGSIFEPFHQAPAGRSAGGLGIGLALVKLLMEMTGGSVSAQSAGQDRGAEFVVRFPRRKPGTDSCASPA